MKKLFIFLSLFLFFLFKPQVSFAEVIREFNTSIVAHKDGTMDITETIVYDFENEYKHGIYRDIPLYSSVGNLYRIISIDNLIVLRDLQNENFSLSNDSKNLNIKIGDANKTIAGAHTYKISYKVSNGIGSNYADYDEIYWNATGNNWQVAIEKAGVTVTTDFDAKLTNLICFQGPIGSKDTTCTVSGNASNSSQVLNPSSGLTIVAVYPVGTFPKSILSKQEPQAVSEKMLSTIFNNILYIFVFFNIILPALLIFWYQKHKNKKRFGPPAVNFDIPKDEKGNILPPALAGTIDSTGLDRNDVVATIFDLAIRKYIKLEEVKIEKKLLPDSKEQIIIKLKKDDGKLNKYEKILFERLFQDGESVNLGSDLKLDFYKTFTQIEDEIFKELVDKKYYLKNPKMQKALFLFLGFFSCFFFNIILGLTFLFLAKKLNGRTALGDEIDFKIDGLKLFLKSMDRNYKWQAEKFYTVEHMIPYAIALGYIDKFMEQLKLIQPDYNPSWYSGSKGSFYAGYAGFYLAASSGITTSAPSSSSGSSGGFSGGGGGGGGGGSW